LVQAAACLLAQEFGNSFPQPKPPTVLIPQAPSFTEADVEVDRFLNIPDAQNQFQVSGKGLAVAVIDSGINTTHIMFAGKLIEGQNFSQDGAANEMRDTGFDENQNIVPNGHGSNVAGIIAGARLPAFEMMPTGIAPDAKIIPLKVFPGGAFDKINLSLKWIIDNRDSIFDEHGVLISVVNMSLGVPGINIDNDSGSNSWPTEIQKQRDLIRELRDMNVAVVVSSGNSYASFHPSQGLSIPGIFKETTSVSAVYDTNLIPNTPPLPRTYVDGGTVREAVAGRLTVFSQRLGSNHSPVFRTDICGPGFFVTSAGPEVGSDPRRTRTTQDGTSQAAPTISGLILLGQQRWRERMGAVDSSFDKKALPSVDALESALRSGGVAFSDVEDAVAANMDNVTSCGDAFVYADAIGFLNQIDAITPSLTPATPTTLQVLQASLYDKSAEEQLKIIDEFKKGEGVFEQLFKRNR
jgi:hypothetical protein